MFYPYLSLWFSEFEGVFLTPTKYRTVNNHSSLTTHTVEEMVGATGIEPVTPTMSTLRGPLRTRCFYAANMLIMLMNGADGGEAAKICSVVRSQKMLIYQWVGLCVSALILLTFFGF